MKQIPVWKHLEKVQKASLVTALLGFIVSFTTTVTSGGVTVHRNWAALVFGILTMILGLASAPGALQSPEHKNEKLIALIVAVLIGVIHIARGLGAFYSN